MSTATPIGFSYLTPKQCGPLTSCFPEMDCSDCYHCPFAVREYDSDFREILVIGCMMRKEVNHGEEAHRI